MSKILIIIKTVFIVLAITVLNIVFLSKSYAGTNALSCGFIIDQQHLGGVPNFSHNNQPLQGVQCQHKPYYSGFLGNWFPSLPELDFRRTQQLLPSYSTLSTPSSRQKISDNYNQSWRLSLAIKRLGRSHLSIFGERKTWQKTQQAKDAILFFPANTSRESNGTIINQEQPTRLYRYESTIGLNLIFPYQFKQQLTELRLQYTTLEQPIQADIPSFDKNSLLTANINLNEILIVSQSRHRGFNLNWQFGIGTGEIILEPENVVNIDSKLSQVISLRSQLELYYQYRISRHWFTHSGWKADIHYWQQSIQKKDHPLLSASTLSQQIYLGIGIKF